MRLECECGDTFYNGVCQRCGAEREDDGSYDSSAVSEERVDLYEVDGMISEAEAELAEEAALGVNPRLHELDLDPIDEDIEEQILDAETEGGASPYSSQEWSMEGEFDEGLDDLLT